MATERYRKNAIASLLLPDGTVTSDHALMASEFLNSFKNRTGTVKEIELGMDILSLVPMVQGLEVLTRPFEVKGIETVINEMPIDKEPGPDDFNGLFLKKFWHIISNDFVKPVSMLELQS